MPSAHQGTRRLLLPLHLINAFLLVLFHGTARADVKLPAIFGNHMVLQQAMAVPVWGWADPGEKVTVTAGTATATTTADQDGKWSVKLVALTASNTPIEMTVAGKNKITLQDVLVGDVWVCSGQSNMEFGIYQDFQEKPVAIPEMRIFLVPKVPSPEPAKDLGDAPNTTGAAWGSWQVCTPETLGQNGTWRGFPAVGYFFGKDIHERTGLPVGMVASDWGGTRVQNWISLEALQSNPEFAPFAKEAVDSKTTYPPLLQAWTARVAQYETQLAQWKIDNQAATAALAQWSLDAQKARAAGQPQPPQPPKPPAPLRPPDPPPCYASALCNGMIAPLAPFAIKGAVWYQGEANAGDIRYRELLPLLITDWRQHWGQGDFPFLIVQLPNCGALQVPDHPGESSWAILREAQAMALSTPATGLAVTIDLGDVGIHPFDKWDVANRLSLVARHVAYGEDVLCSGPVYKGLTVEGSKIRVQFDPLDGSLVVGKPPEHCHPLQGRPPSNDLLGFAVAGADGKYEWAQAQIDGTSVLLGSALVPNPVSVRYAWADNPAANLYNKSGFPAAPFRTDNNKP
jgi:sialate O-acetylesterase